MPIGSHVGAGRRLARLPCRTAERGRRRRDKGRRYDSCMPINAESSAVQAHLAILQGVIQRMAENSRSCKIWSVTLVSAILVLVARTGEPRHALLALAPVALFLLLDAYYLALERAFRKSYEAVVAKLHKGRLEPGDLYAVKPVGMGVRLVVSCLGAFSVCLFYAVLTITIALAWLLVLPSDSVLGSGG